MPDRLPLPVGIVGAGLAGLAAAHALGAASVASVVVEKSRGVGGRAATRWRDIDGTRWRVDHGAQVFTPEPGSRADQLTRAVTEPVEIEGPVVPFSADGTVRPDDARTGGPPRLCFADGYAALARSIADATPGLDLHLSTTVTALACADDGTWTIAATDSDGQAVTLGPFRAVVLTPPSPQAAAHAPFDDLAQALAAVTYRSQFGIVLAFDTPVALPHGAYALVNAPADGHAVAWLADETRKPNRAPDGAGLLVAQMSDAWTQAHYDADRADVVTAATEHIEALAGALPARLWADTQRWRYSLPDGGVRAARAGEARGLYVAGDAVAGQGRAHLALETGLDAAARLLAADRNPAG